MRANGKRSFVFPLCYYRMNLEPQKLLRINIPLYYRILLKSHKIFIFRVLLCYFHCRLSWFHDRVYIALWASILEQICVKRGVDVSKYSPGCIAIPSYLFSISLGFEKLEEWHKWRGKVIICNLVLPILRNLSVFIVSNLLFHF